MATGQTMPISFVLLGFLGCRYPAAKSAWAQLSVSRSAASCPNNNWKEMERDGGSVRVVWGTQRSGSSRGCPLGH